MRTARMRISHRRYNLPSWKYVTETQDASATYPPVVFLDGCRPDHGRIAVRSLEPRRSLSVDCGVERRHERARITDARIRALQGPPGRERGAVQEMSGPAG